MLRADFPIRDRFAVRKLCNNRLNIRCLRWFNPKCPFDSPHKLSFPFGNIAFLLEAYLGPLPYSVLYSESISSKSLIPRFNCPSSWVADIRLSERARSRTDIKRSNAADDSKKSRQRRMRRKKFYRNLLRVVNTRKVNWWSRHGESVVEEYKSKHFSSRPDKIATKRSNV